MADTAAMITPSSDAGAGSSSFTDALIRIFWRCGTFVTGVVALVAGVLYYKQESLLYFPSIGEVPRHTAQNPRRYRSPSEHNIPFETHLIQCEDGTTIHSWLLYHPDNSNSNNNNDGSSSSNNNKKKVPTILFFHGNAGNIGMRLPNAIQMYHYLRANIWLIEYRGYGDSDDATPTEAGLKMDSEAVWNYINNSNYNSQRNNNHNSHHLNLHNQHNLHSVVDPRRVFVFGRSLGGAVAFYLAGYSQTTSYPPLAGVIVENTFLSISEMVDHLMPYVAPFKALILRIGWDSGKIAPIVRIPTLFLAGAKDTLVPHSHMLELYERMKSSKVGNLVRMHVVEDGTHNETWMQGGREYWMAVQRFIDEVFAAERPSGASYSRSGGKSSSKGPLIQRKGSSGKASSSLLSTSCSSLSGECLSALPREDSVEVDLGFAGGDAADMISSVGDILGMAKEATRNVAGVTGMGGAGAYKKKD